ncbi:hypothetical protein CFREI_12680 [Corynebacterium freiburgense]|nr:hypothetical protein CFREI_12680 [Corynebacterium freiburgense]
MIAQIITICAAFLAFGVYLWTVLARRRGWWFSWWLAVPILLFASTMFMLRLAGAT